MTWRDNMTNKGEPRIIDNNHKEDYTKITFKPDLSKFKMDKFEGDIIPLMKKRVNLKLFFY